jgi:hypothetical protein
VDEGVQDAVAPELVHGAELPPESRRVQPRQFRGALVEPIHRISRPINQSTNETTMGNMREAMDNSKAKKTNCRLAHSQFLFSLPLLAHSLL